MDKVKSYNIYYRDREFAKVNGDPLLGNVSARTEKEAIKRAYKKGINCNGAGLMAINCANTMEDFFNMDDWSEVKL